MFKLWDGINSGLYDEQMLDLRKFNRGHKQEKANQHERTKHPLLCIVANLSKIHLNPSLSSPKRLEDIPKSMVNEVPEDEVLHDGDEMDLDGEEAEEDVTNKDAGWQGIRKDIGILTESEFQTVMTKCLRAMSESRS